MKKNRAKRIWLRTLLIILIGSFSIACIAYLVSRKSKKESIQTYLQKELDDTYFDDFIEEELEEKLINLEKYVKLSNELNKIVGKKYSIEEKYLEDEKLKEPDEINQIIENFNKSNKDVSFLKELKIQSCLINKYLKTDGYEIMADALLYGLKIEFVDAYGLDENISKQIYETITIPSYNQMKFDSIDDRVRSVNIQNNKVYFNNKLENILSLVYTLQNNDSKENTTGYNYNKDRNEMLEEGLYDLKSLIESNSEFRKLKIK